MKKPDKNSNTLCGETSLSKGSKKFLLRQQEDTEAMEEIKEYEDTAAGELRETGVGNAKRRAVDW